MKKIFLVAAVLMALSGLALAITTSVTSTTIPDGPGTIVATAATLSCSSDNQPWVQYKFELPDEDPVMAGTQVYPVPGKNKDVDVYLIVCDKAGASDIGSTHSTLTYPNPPGTFLTQEVNTPVTVGIDAILTNATNTGLITSAQKADIKRDINTNKNCSMYKHTYTLDNCDPAGMYGVTAWSCNDCGCGPDCTGVSNQFQYISIVAADVDFTSLNYGAITGGNPKTVAGDCDMSTPNAPTVQNLGNDPMDVVIAATDMIGFCGNNPLRPVTILANKQTAKIDHVDGQQTLSCSGTCFDVNLMCEQPAKITFVLTAPTGTCATAYSGNITVTGVHSCAG